MVVPFGSPASHTVLEIHPTVYFYTDKDDPVRVERREQDPLLVVESHLTHILSKRFWAGIDLRYRTGGETTTDGVSEDHQMGQLAGGISLGWQVTRAFQLQGSHGGIIAKNDDSEGDMIRVRPILVF